MNRKYLFHDIYNRIWVDWVPLYVDSAPALPEMYDTCHRCDVDKRISALGVPTTLTLTSNASGLFVAISCLFIAQIDSNYVEFDLVVLVGLVC